MIRYFCDRCGREISKDTDREILLLRGELLMARFKKTRDWMRPVLCNACAVALENWLKQENTNES